ncbi:MAG: DUF4198 domain-containing protein [Deltaproteobacteria bacterium]|nr:DUF4198 domain-containing protein [Deltaproteobacteria bacterium]
MKTKCKGKKLSGFVIVAMILFLPVSPSSAHNLWLGLDHYDQRKGDTAKVFLYLAHSLPFADLAKPEKMKEFYYVGPSGKKINFDLKKPDSESFFNEVGVPLNLKDEGTYLAAVDMKPVYISLTPEGRKMKSKKELPDAISCRYVEFFAKAVFHAGKPGGNAYKTVLGQTIEMVPQKDPGMIKNGEYFPIKVLFKGKPLAHEFVYATYVGFSTREEYPFTARTDADGIVKIRITRPGIWWVKIPLKKIREEKSECDVDQYAAILTFEVK